MMAALHAFRSISNRRPPLSSIRKPCSVVRCCKQILSAIRDWMQEVKLASTVAQRCPMWPSLSFLSLEDVLVWSGTCQMGRCASDERSKKEVRIGDKTPGSYTHLASTRTGHSKHWPGHRHLGGSLLRRTVQRQMHLCTSVHAAPHSHLCLCMQPCLPGTPPVRANAFSINCMPIREHLNAFCSEPWCGTSRSCAATGYAWCATGGLAQTGLVSMAMTRNKW